VGLFGASSDRDDLLALENRVVRLEEQVARLSAALAARPVAQEASAPEGDGSDVVPPSDDGYAEARALAAAGNKIHAIKVVREQSGISLRAAKDLVEGWEPVNR
jgi:large subunit ribosomal protein L7/L12